MTHQSTEYEEDHKDSTESRLASNVPVTDGRHSDQREIYTVPIAEVLRISMTSERIVRVFHLHAD